MLTIKSLKAKPISGNPETDIHATWCQKQLHILFGILGVLVTQSSLGVNFCIIPGSPAFTDNEQENKTSQKWKTSREESLLITFRRTYFSQPSRPPALEEAHFLTKTGFHLQRAVLLWPDRKYSTVPQEKKKCFCLYGFTTSYVSFKM